MAPAVHGTRARERTGMVKMYRLVTKDAAAYAKLKSTLTPDQITKMKDLLKSKEAVWKNKSKEGRSSSKSKI